MAAWAELGTRVPTPSCVPGPGLLVLFLCPAYRRAVGFLARERNRRNPLRAGAGNVVCSLLGNRILESWVVPNSEKALGAGKKPKPTNALFPGPRVRVPDASRCAAAWRDFGGWFVAGVEGLP